MVTLLMAAVHVLALVVVVAGGVACARGREPGRTTWWPAVALEAVLAVQAVVAAVRLAGGYRPAETAVFVGYLLGVLVVVPVALGWVLVERSRYNGAVLAVAALSVSVMTVRMHQMWTVTGG